MKVLLNSLQITHGRNKMTDNELINYYEIQEEKMAREIMKLKFIIENLKNLNKRPTQKAEKLKKLKK